MGERDEIVQALAEGLSTKQVAQRFDLPVKDVRDLLREATKEMADGAALREEWFLEDQRLKALELLFYAKAMRDQNPADAMIVVKTSERRATLAGANAPQSHAIHVMNQAPPAHHRTSTERIRDVLDNVMGITPRERKLLDRKDHLTDEPPLTEEEVAELTQLTGGREAKNPGRLP